MKSINQANFSNSIRVNSAKKLITSLTAVGLSLGFATSASAVELLKFMVSEPGMQRVAYEDIPADFDLRGLKHNKFNILHNGEPIEIRVVGQTVGSERFFGPGAYIEFYAKPEESLYTTESAYSLHYMTNREIRSIGRKRIAEDNVGNIKNAPVQQSYSHTQTIEQNSYYDFAAPSKTDPWHYGQNFSFFPTPTYSFELKDVVGGSASATVSAEMYGLLDFQIEGNDHHYEVLVNDILLGDQQFDGNAADQFVAENAVVNEGANTFRYNYRPIAGVAFDIVALNKITVTYPRFTNAVDDRVDGEFASAHISISNVAEGDFGVYRIENSEDSSNPTVTRLSNAERQADGTIIFNASSQPGRYITLGESGYEKPRVQRLLAQSNISQGSAQYLIIAHQSLIGDELDRLVELRSQSYSVKVVDVAQVYEQFGDGLPDPEAIHKYIKFATENLDTKFAVLVGSDTYDYKQYGNTGSISLIPTPYTSTPGGFYYVTQTPADAIYGDLNDDGLMDIPVGRITSRTPQELGWVVDKLEAYEARQGYAGRVLMAADKEDSGNGVSFTQDAEAMIDAMPDAWKTAVRDDFKAFPDIDGGQLAHDKTIAALNAGVSVVSFIGHSSHRRWSFSTPPVLQSSEIASLTNSGRPALVTQWGCWNSYYVDPAGNTMADEFLVGGPNGAATVLGASTLTTAAGERALGIELNSRMYEEGITIGEAVIQAKRALAAKEDYPAIQYGWQIIGDPALEIDPR